MDIIRTLKSENERIGNGGGFGRSGFGQFTSLAGGLYNGHEHIPPQAARGGGGGGAAGLGGQGE